MSKYIFPLLLLPLAAFMLWSLYTRHSADQKFQNIIHENHRTVTALITDKTETRIGKGPNFKLTVEYELDGQKYTAKSSVSRDLYTLSSVGSNIDIRLHPADRHVFDCDGCGAAIQGDEALAYYVFTGVMVFGVLMWSIFRKK